MIKARVGNTVIFGLSALNVEKLMEGYPILFDASGLGLHGIHVSILYGRTEAEIVSDLEGMGLRVNPI